MQTSATALVHTSGIILIQAIETLGPGLKLQTLALGWPAPEAPWKEGAMRGLRESRTPSDRMKPPFLAAFLALCSLAPMIDHKSQGQQLQYPEVRPLDR